VVAESESEDDEDSECAADGGLLVNQPRPPHLTTTHSLF
jgi:hypothetical protein